MLKKIIKSLIFTSLFAPTALTVFSCSNKTSLINSNRDVIKNPSIEINGKLITDRDHFSDILISMGVKPFAQSQDYVLSNPTYFDKLGIRIPVFPGFAINMSPFDSEKFQVYKPKVLIGSGPSQGSSFNNIFEPKYNYYLDTQEKIKVSVNKTEKGSYEWNVLDVYQTWREVAKFMDSFYKQEGNSKHFEEKIEETINFIKYKIKSIKENLQNDGKSIILYGWGEDRDLNSSSVNEEISQFAIMPYGPLNNIVYSKEGLGFSAPVFNTEKNLGINQWGVITQNGNSQLQESLNNQNDYVIINSQYPSRKYPNKDDFKKQGTWSYKMVKDGNVDNLFICDDFNISIASYGPIGVNHILNYFIEIFKIKDKVFMTQIPGVQKSELKEL